MRTLRVGSVGDDVRQWEAFLRGRGLFMEEADGTFDGETGEAVAEFQRRSGMRTDDGVIGPLTWAKGLELGLHYVEDDSEDQSGPNWPPKPAFEPLSSAQRQQVFTQFSFTPAPTEGNPEAIRMDPSWVKTNIVSVEIPQLRGVNGTAGATRFSFHRFAQYQVAGLFLAWEKLGLLPLVKSWGGSFAPRFIRGSRTSLSNHSYGSAFDINVPWNGLGATPALVGRGGSVRTLVPVANRLGFYWGGHFSRPDGMHFEVARTMDAAAVEAVIGAL